MGNKEHNNETYSMILRHNLKNKSMSNMMKKIVEEIFLRRTHELEQTDSEFDNRFWKFY